MQDHCWLMHFPEEVYLFLFNSLSELCFQNVKVQQKPQIISLPTEI